jgi:hypothetical protein
LLKGYDKYSNKELREMIKSLAKETDKLNEARRKKWTMERQCHEDAHLISYKLSGLNQRIYSMGLKLGMNKAKGCPAFVTGMKDPSSYVKGDMSIPYRCVMREDRIWGKYFFSQCRECKLRNDKDLQMKVTIKLLKGKDDSS